MIPGRPSDWRGSWRLVSVAYCSKQLSHCNSKTQMLPSQRVLLEQAFALLRRSPWRLMLVLAS